MKRIVFRPCVEDEYGNVESFPGLESESVIACAMMADPDIHDYVGMYYIDNDGERIHAGYDFLLNGKVAQTKVVNEDS